MCYIFSSDDHSHRFTLLDVPDENIPFVEGGRFSSFSLYDSNLVYTVTGKLPWYCKSIAKCQSKGFVKGSIVLRCDKRIKKAVDSPRRESAAFVTDHGLLINRIYTTYSPISCLPSPSSKPLSLFDDILEQIRCHLALQIFRLWK